MIRHQGKFAAEQEVFPMSGEIHYRTAFSFGGRPVASGPDSFLEPYAMTCSTPSSDIWENPRNAIGLPVRCQNKWLF